MIGNNWFTIYVFGIIAIVYPFFLKDSLQLFQKKSDYSTVNLLSLITL